MVGKEKPLKCWSAASVSLSTGHGTSYVGPRQQDSALQTFSSCVGLGSWDSKLSLWQQLVLQLHARPRYWDSSASDNSQCHSSRPQVSDPWPWVQNSFSQQSLSTGSLHPSTLLQPQLSSSLLLTWPRSQIVQLSFVFSRFLFLFMSRCVCLCEYIPRTCKSHWGKKRALYSPDLAFQMVVSQPPYMGAGNWTLLEEQWTLFNCWAISPALSCQFVFVHLFVFLFFNQAHVLVGVLLNP